jgi:P27 family predicted phage terminase small subunit
MGRPPKPTRLKLLEGTTRKDRANPAEPKPPAARAKEAPPRWLRTSSHPWWKRIRPLLVQMQVLTGADPVALGLLCDALADYMAARAVVAKQGATFETNGDAGLMIRQRPEVAIAADSWRRAKLMLTEFGLTPAARAKVTAADVGPIDPLEEWEQTAAKP